MKHMRSVAAAFRPSPTGCMHAAPAKWLVFSAFALALIWRDK
jgi:hypothetical protein